MNCKDNQPHWFASIEMNKQDHPAPGESCRRCGIVYCPVAYDHFDPDLVRCAVCGAESEYEYGY